jgi:hypothetical protein
MNQLGQYYLSKMSDGQLLYCKAVAISIINRIKKDIYSSIDSHNMSAAANVYLNDYFIRLCATEANIKYVSKPQGLVTVLINLLESNGLKLIKFDVTTKEMIVVPLIEI